MMIVELVFNPIQQHFIFFGNLVSNAEKFAFFHDKYCVRKQRQNMYEALDPQSMADEIIKLSRYYCKVKADRQYV